MKWTCFPIFIKFVDTQAQQPNGAEYEHAQPIKSSDLQPLLIFSIKRTVSTYLFMDLCFWRFLLSDLAINSYQEKNLCLSNFRNIHKIWKVIFSFLCLLFVLLVSFSQSASHVIPNIDKYKYERNYEWCLGVCQPAIHLQPCLLTPRIFFKEPHFAFEKTSFQILCLRIQFIESF